MGRPSDKRRSARRLGKHERARVKKRMRAITYKGSAAGWLVLKAGRKKWLEAGRSRNADNPWSFAHLSVKR